MSEETLVERARMIATKWADGKIGEELAIQIFGAGLLNELCDRIEELEEAQVEGLEEAVQLLAQRNETLERVHAAASRAYFGSRPGTKERDLAETISAITTDEDEPS